jgi:propanediol utilization protein
MSEESLETKKTKMVVCPHIHFLRMIILMPTRFSGKERVEWNVQASIEPLVAEDVYCRVTGHPDAMMHVAI